MRKKNFNSINVEQSDEEKVNRSVEVTYYTIKGKTRIAYCDVRITTDGRTVVSQGDAISKSDKDYQTLIRRAEAVGYARCLSMLDNGQDDNVNNVTTDEGVSHE